MPMASDQRFLQQQFLRLCPSVGLTAGSLVWSIAAVGQAALQLIQVAADLKAMGFDMVSRANNHLFDLELEGMFATNALLDEAGISHAGSGKNLDEAAVWKSTKVNRSSLASASFFARRSGHFPCRWT